LIDRYWRELYRVCLLLNEIVTPSQYPIKDLMFQTRPARREAVAARHWFSTACPVVFDQDDSDPLVPLALPGLFGVRGDWYLAVARGSRSIRLAERAIDLLCSRRSNVTRVQAGVGLPVRRFLMDKKAPKKGLNRDQRSEFWTPLSHFGTKGDGKRESIRYDDLLRLAAWDESDNPQGRRAFHWLWRSTIHGYDRHCRIWQKWLAYIFKDARHWLKPRDGFDQYDSSKGGNAQFNALCKNLRYILGRARDRKREDR
jgi:hypothetical protein